MDPQFLSSALANAIGGFTAGLAVSIVCLASRKVSRAIIRWRTSRLRKGYDANRAAEELEGWTVDLTPAERAGLAADLLLHSTALRRELAAWANDSAATVESPEDDLRALRAILPQTAAEGSAQRLQEIEEFALEAAARRPYTRLIPSSAGDSWGKAFVFHDLKHLAGDSLSDEELMKATKAVMCSGSYW